MLLEHGGLKEDGVPDMRVGTSEKYKPTGTFLLFRVLVGIMC
jgi:hypothetical protein